MRHLRDSNTKGAARLEATFRTCTQSVRRQSLLAVVCAVGVCLQTASAAPPSSTLELLVTARQWDWSFTYPDDDIVSQTLVVPVNRPVALKMTSIDVQHAFSAPTLGLEHDIIPGHEQIARFRATEVGTHKLVCAKDCGRGHAGMVSDIKVVTQADYDSWIATGGNPELVKKPMAEIGRHYYQLYGCSACHSEDGTARVGPTFKGLYGSTAECTDGPCEVTEDYIRESIEDPSARVVKGFAPQMPSYKARVKTAPPNGPSVLRPERDEMKAIIAFLKSLR